MINRQKAKQFWFGALETLLKTCLISMNLFNCFQENCFWISYVKRGGNIQSICLENSWKEFYWFAKFSKDFRMRNLTFLLIRYFFQSTLKLITTKLRFLPRLGKKTHTQSISFCHASLAQFASGDDALLCCNTSFFFLCHFVSLKSFSCAIFPMRDRECFGSFDHTIPKSLIFVQKFNFKRRK